MSVQYKREILYENKSIFYYYWFYFFGYYCGQYGAISFKHNYPLRKMIHTEYLNDIEDRKFAENPNTHCDFLIFNKLDKSILLVVEVDGNQHNDPIQRQRDVRKDRILNRYDIPVLRLRTTETDCEMKIKAALRMAAV